MCFTVSGQIFQGPNTVIHTGAMMSTVTELFGQYLRQISKQMCLLLQQNSSGMTVGIYCTAYWEVRLWIKTGLFSRTSLLLVLFPGFVDRKRKKNMISCFLKPKVEQGEHPVHSGRGKNDEM